MNDSCTPGGHRRVYAVAFWATYTPDSGVVAPHVVGYAESVLATSHMEADAWAAQEATSRLTGPQWSEHGWSIKIVDQRLIAVDGTQCPPPAGHVLGGRPEDLGLGMPPGATL